MKAVKKDSSLWIKTKSRQFRNFHWQDGYGAFSIGKSDIPELKKYIATQKEHHRKRTFKEELIEFLDEYGIADVSMLGWVRNLVGFYGAGELVDYASLRHVPAWLERCLARPAVQRGLTIPARPA